VRANPRKKFGHLVVVVRADHELAVVGQNAIGQDADRVALVGLNQHALECIEIAIVSE
jgi:hypothetical protein